MFGGAFERLGGSFVGFVGGFVVVGEDGGVGGLRLCAAEARDGLWAWSLGVSAMGLEGRESGLTMFEGLALRGSAGKCECIEK